MAMGRRRKRAQQERLWTPTAALPVGASHPFYQRLNQILDERKFDEYVETICGSWKLPTYRNSFKLRSFELEEGVVCRPLRPRSLPGAWQERHYTRAAWRPF